MALNAEFQNRQVIPRWHPFEVARSLGYTCPSNTLVAPKILTSLSYQQKLDAWKSQGALTYAIDLVGTALLAADYGNSEVNRACRFIQKSKSQVSTLAMSVADAFLARSQQGGTVHADLVLGDTRNRASATVAILRAHLIQYPNDPIAWVDLALQYTLLALVDKARRAVTVALQLAPHNRFVLRAASRFFLHTNQPDWAVSILRSSTSIQHDPWLLASEISICEATAQRTKFAKKARAVALNTSLHAHDRSELCSALATLEFNSGSAKKAKQFFECSLESPNENAVAQFEWIQPKARLSIVHDFNNVPGIFEAEARRSMRNAEFLECFNFANSWLDFQPFSSRPAVLGSYVALLGIRDDNRALELIDKAELASPDDPMLLNNQACALATVGRIDEAVEVIRRIDTSNIPSRETGSIWATIGLIHFRSGEIERAREFYDKAAALFLRDKDEASLSICYLYRGREEDRINHESSDDYLSKALKIAQKLGQKEIISYVESILTDRKLRNEKNISKAT